MPFSLIQPLSSIPVACIDVETTGASAEMGDRIIEVGVVRFENGQIFAQYEQLIDPQRWISAGVTALTGITQAMCHGQPTFTQQLPAMLPLLQGAAILGHNVRFDLSFLVREFRRAAADIEQLLAGAAVLDTVRIARRRFGRGGNALGLLARRLGYQPPAAHRALPDARTTLEVFDRLLQPMGGWRTCLCDALREQGGPMGLVPPAPRQQILPLELEEALELGCPVIMEYLDAHNRRTQRVVQPLNIRRFGDELLLIAHCHLRNDRRTFKLQRIVQLTRLDAPPPPAAPTAAAALPAATGQPSLRSV
ncbi:MAG: exonuclease domain-containing protein [Tepidisphaeraceae bacterium]|jgi:DNA polymerase III epsilon subunit family exonuclease